MEHVLEVVNEYLLVPVHTGAASKSSDSEAALHSATSLQLANDFFNRSQCMLLRSRSQVAPKQYRNLFLSHSH